MQWRERAAAEQAAAPLDGQPRRVAVVGATEALAQAVGCSAAAPLVCLVSASTSASSAAAAAAVAGGTPWRADLKKASHARALRDRLVGLAAGGGGLVVCGEACGSAAVRVAQLWAALPVAPSRLVLLVAPPKPDELRAAARDRVVWAAGEAQFAARAVAAAADTAAAFAAGVAACCEATADGGVEVLDGGLVVATRQTAADRPAAAYDAPPVARSVAMQMDALRERIERVVMERRDPALALSDGTLVSVERSTPARFAEAGFAAEHYVPEAPDAHDACFELRTADGGEPVAYIALGAYGTDGSVTYPFASPHRMLVAAQVDRLVVLPAWRGRGAFQLLLRVCDAYVQDGLPVRIKTAREEVHHVFARCALLAYEGYKAPGETRMGVKRPVKRYVSLGDAGPPAAPQPEPAPRACAGGCCDAETAMRQLNGALNKLTADNYERVTSGLVAQLGSADAPLRRRVAETVVIKAARTPQRTYRRLYARALAALGVEGPAAREALSESFAAASAQAASARASWGTPEALERALDDAGLHLRCAAGFLGELLAAGVVQTGDVLERLDTLMRAPAPDGPMAACDLLDIAGPALDRKDVERASAKLAALAADDAVPPAVRARCAELSARASKASQRRENMPTVSDVRLDAARELGVTLAAPGEVRRGERAGWVHVYVGTEVVCPQTGRRYRYVGGPNSKAPFEAAS